MHTAAVNDLPTLTGQHSEIDMADLLGLKLTRA
jgi:hypothetical protein